LQIKENKATLPTKEEEECGQAHESRMELPCRLSRELKITLTIPNLPTQPRTKSHHGGQDDAHVSTCMVIRKGGERCEVLGVWRMGDKRRDDRGYTDEY